MNTVSINDLASKSIAAINQPIQLLVNGDQVVTIPEEMQAQCRPGDSLVVVNETQKILHIPADDRLEADRAVAVASAAFAQMNQVTDAQITEFFTILSTYLKNDDVWAQIQRANESDVQRATKRGRSTTRLEATPKMRQLMIDGLAEQQSGPSIRDQVLKTKQHDGWSVSEIAAPLGVVGFVFEGRPNVLVDAAGVLRSGNTVVFRIGQDALNTAQTMMTVAIQPALRDAGLPEHAMSLVQSPNHAAGWALFSNPKLGLAVARGSGEAVSTLGGCAQQAGVPVSLHGTGGAWMVVDHEVDSAYLSDVVFYSLDRKVCNTLNTICIMESSFDTHWPVIYQALTKAAQARQSSLRLHIAQKDKDRFAADLFTTNVTVERAHGRSDEPCATVINDHELGQEWEWESSPEVTVVVVSSLEEGVELINQHSPQFVASLVSQEADHHQLFYQLVNAPFVGNGFTRWADGQYAFHAPELGLSNWQNGRSLARSAILSGDAVFTIRNKMVQTASNVHR